MDNYQNYISFYDVPNYYPTQNMDMPFYMPQPTRKPTFSFNMQSTLRTAQKTINTMNQVIPIIYQVRPILSNAKTAFRVIKAVNQMDLSPTLEKEIDEAISKNTNPSKTSPNFENML